jgi:hypothetical protein
MSLRSRLVVPSDRVQRSILFVQGVEFFFGEIFRINEAVAGSLKRRDQLVELDVQGEGLLVLRALDQEDHQERQDGRAGVNHELPGVGKVEDWANNPPDQHDTQRQEKRLRSAGYLGGPDGKPLQQVSARLVAGCVARFMPSRPSLVSCTWCHLAEFLFRIRSRSARDRLRRRMKFLEMKKRD